MVGPRGVEVLLQLDGHMLHHIHHALRSTGLSPSDLVCGRSPSTRLSRLERWSFFGTG